MLIENFKPVTCPHCGHKHRPPGDLFDQYGLVAIQCGEYEFESNITCPVCDTEIDLVIEIKPAKVKSLTVIQ